MSEAFPQLLDATIQYLQGLKDQGVRFLSVDSETMVALKTSARPGRVAVQPDAAIPPPTPARPVVAPSIRTVQVVSQRSEREDLLLDPVQPSTATAMTTALDP